MTGDRRSETTTTTSSSSAERRCQNAKPSAGGFKYTLEEMVAMYSDLLTVDQKCRSELEKHRLIVPQNFSKVIESIRSAVNNRCGSKATARATQGSRSVQKVVPSEQRKPPWYASFARNTNSAVNVAGGRSNDNNISHNNSSNNDRLARNESVAKQRNFSHLLVPIPFEVVEKGRFDATITFVKRLESFFIVSEEMKSKYEDKLELLIEREVTSSYSRSNFLPESKKFYFVKDGLADYSRTYCYETDQKAQLAKVYCLDSGQSKTVSLRAMSPILCATTGIPMLAVHCALRKYQNAKCAADGSMKTEIEFIKRASKGPVQVSIISHCVNETVVAGLPLLSLVVELYDKTTGAAFSEMLFKD